MNKFNRTILAYIIFLFSVSVSTNLQAQQELKVELIKGMSLLQFEFGFEHYKSEKISFVHQASLPAYNKQTTGQGKPFSFRYMFETRAYYPNANNQPFISLAQRLSFYRSFTDYELGFLIGQKFNSKTQPFNFELKVGYLRSLNNQFEFQPFFDNTDPKNNFIVNCTIGFKL